MLVFEITSTKAFMNLFLAGDAFDDFLLEEAVIRTANTYTIDGHIHPEFYPPEERSIEYLPYSLQPWSQLKGICFDLIKGRHTPLFFKFVLQLKPERASSLLAQFNCQTDISQIKALVLNIRYDGNRACLTTGISYHTFVPDKEADAIWDKAFLPYLSDREIAFEILS